jgi:restriction system protein
MWVVKGGRSGEHEDRFLEHSIVGMGFSAMPSLASFPTREALKAGHQAAYPDDSAGRRGVQVGQFWAFVHDMEVGDLVVVPLKTRAQIAVGTIAGPYEYTDKFGTDLRHIRPVKWVRTDFPRTAFDQDLLYSFGSFMTVCTVHRNNAEARVQAMLKGHPLPAPGTGQEGLPEVDLATPRDLEQDGRDQVVDLVRTRFKGHGLARIVDGILRAQGFVTRMSTPGPDGGVDIAASAGIMGFDHPRVAVQVKSGDGPASAEVLRALKGTMSDYGAEQGLLVCWGGFTTALQSEARTGYFKIRLWNQRDVLDALFANYERLDDDLKAELPLKRIWTVAREALEED